MKIDFAKLGHGPVVACQVCVANMEAATIWWVGGDNSCKHRGAMALGGGTGEPLQHAILGLVSIIDPANNPHCRVHGNPSFHGAHCGDGGHPHPDGSATVDTVGALLGQRGPAQRCTVDCAGLLQHCVRRQVCVCLLDLQGRGDTGHSRLLRQAGTRPSPSRCCC